MKISDLIPDERNANKGTDRGREMLESSLQKYGAGRSILIDKNMRIIAGNKTAQEAENAGFEDVIIVPSDGKKIIAVQRTDLDLTKDKEARELAYADNRVAEVDLKWDIEEIQLDIQDIDLDIGEFFSEEELKDFKEELNKEEDKSGPHSTSYNDEEMPEIEEYKCVYRVEAMNFVPHTKLIELFAGRGALTYWYKRVFSEVITNDNQKFDGVNHTYNLTAEKFIKTELKKHLDFTYIDFDDEGCPGEEIQLFFDTIKNKTDSFVLAVTDGQGLNLKSRGRINLRKTYLQGENKTIQATENMYNSFADIFREFINQLSVKYGFKYRELSLHRKSNGNCIYATYLIEKQ